MFGGDGNDTIGTGTGDDQVDGDADATTSASTRATTSAGRRRQRPIRGTAGNDTLYGEAGNDYVQGGDGNDKVYGGDGNDDLDGGLGNDILYGGGGDDHISADEGDDIIYAGVGVDDVYGETGADTIYVLEDGIRDEFYCAPAASGEPGDHIVFVGRPTGQDHINGCDRKLDAFVADGSPEYSALLPYFGSHAARFCAGRRQPLGDQPVGSRRAPHDRHHDAP